MLAAFLCGALCGDAYRSSCYATCHTRQDCERLDQGVLEQACTSSKQQAASLTMSGPSCHAFGGVEDDHGRQLEPPAPGCSQRVWCLGPEGAA